MYIPHTYSYVQAHILYTIRSWMRCELPSWDCTFRFSLQSTLHNIYSIKLCVSVVRPFSCFKYVHTWTLPKERRNSLYCIATWSKFVIVKLMKVFWIIFCTHFTDPPKLQNSETYLFEFWKHKYRFYFGRLSSKFGQNEGEEM